MIRKPKFLQENVNRLAGKDLRIFVFLILCGCSAKAPNHNAALADSWQELPGIIESIEQPSFRNADYNIMDYGAIGDGYSDCTEAFRKAIVACHSEGGGRVVAPEGVFLTGAIAPVQQRTSPHPRQPDASRSRASKASQRGVAAARVRFAPTLD